MTRSLTTLLVVADACGKKMLTLNVCVSLDDVEAICWDAVVANHWLA